MKRMLIIGSSILVALAACDERIDRDRVTPSERVERAAPEAREEIREEREELRDELTEPRVERPLSEPRATLDEPAPDTLGATPPEKTDDQQPVAGRTEGETEKQVTAGTSSDALSHLPADCKAVTHANMSKLSELPGAKEHLIPAIQEARKGDPNLAQLVSLLKEGGIESPKSIDDVAICVKDVPTQAEAQSGKINENSDVVLVATGDVPEGELVKALQKRAPASEPIDISGRKVFHHEKSKLFVGQTADGTIIAARERGAIESAFSASGSDYDLPTDKAFGVLIPQSTMQALLERFGDPAAKKLGEGVSRTTIVFDSDKNQLSLRIEMPDHTKAAELGGVFKAQLEQWKAKPPTNATEKRFANVLKDAKVEYDDETIHLKVDVKDDQIEAMMKNLADQVRSMST